jgi:DNA-directed RNA polymerase specialized sigma24 family protein
MPLHPSIEELREEFAANGLEGWLWPWMNRVLQTFVFAMIKPRYPARAYSPSRAWDTEGAWDLVQEFIAERGHVAIQSALLVAVQPTGVKKYLEKALLNFMISERRRDTASNVRSRLSDLLDSSPVLRRLAGFGARGAYGLDEWSEEPPDIMDPACIREAERFFPGDVRLTSYSVGTRHSPGLASADLATVAVALISGTGRLWTAGQIMTLVESRFVLSDGDPDAPSDSEGELTRMRAAERLDAVVVAELAARAVEELTDPQRTILQLITDEPGLAVRAIADRVGLSKSQVNKEQHRIAAVFVRLGLARSDEREQVLNAVAELLGGQRDSIGSSI